MTHEASKEAGGNAGEASLLQQTAAGYVGVRLSGVIVEDSLPDQEGVALYEAAVLLRDIRQAFRDGRVKTAYRPTAQFRAAAERFAGELANNCGHSDDASIRSVQPDQLYLFGLGMATYSRQEGRDGTMIDQDPVALSAGRLYVQDAVAIQCRGVSEGFKLAQYHDVDIVDSVYALCAQYPDVLSPSDAKATLNQFTQRPLEHLTARVARFVELTERVLPAMRDKYDTDCQWPISYSKRIASTRPNVAVAAEEWFTERAAMMELYGHGQRGKVEAFLRERLSCKKLRELAAVPAVTMERDDLDLEQAAGDLDIIRLIGKSKRRSSNADPTEIDLLRHLGVNAHLFGDQDMDLAAVAKFITSGVRSYNMHEGKAQPISTSHTHLLAMACVYGDDARVIAEHTGPYYALQFAKSLDPRQYLTLIGEYSRVTGLPQYLLNNLIARSFTNPEAMLEGVAGVGNMLRQEFAGKLSIADIIRVTFQANKRHDVALKIARCLIHEFPAVFESLGQEYPQFDERLARDIFIAAKEPAKELRAMAENAARIKESHIGRLLTHTGCVTLLWRNRTLEPEAAAERYLEIFTSLQRRSAERGVILSDRFLAFWALKSPRTDAVDKHIATCQAYESWLARSGVEVSDNVLSEMAYKWPDNLKAEHRVGRYLYNRQRLQQWTEFNLGITQDMIDQAAVASSERLARSALELLVSYAAAGRRFDDAAVYSVYRHSGERKDGIAAQADRTAQDAYRHAAIAMDLDAWFEPLQALAIKHVFNLEYADDEDWLMSVLGVDDLEDYVQRELLPVLRQKLMAEAA